MSKTKVLSVRLSMPALQSCFDLCELLSVPTNGASGAIARSIEALTSDLRSKGTLPTYKSHELAHLLKSFMSSKNPTSMASLESLSSYNIAVDARPESYAPVDRRTDYVSQDFAPMCSIELHSAIAKEEEKTFQQVNDEANEYKDLVDEQIQATIAQEEQDLLSKILIGG